MGTQKLAQHPEKVGSSDERVLLSDEGAALKVERIDFSEATRRSLTTHLERIQRPAEEDEERAAVAGQAVG